MPYATVDALRATDRVDVSDGVPATLLILLWLLGVGH